MKITPALLTLLRPEIDAALAAVGKKYNLSFRTGAGSYSELAATFKLEVGTIGEGGEIIDKTAAFLRSNLYTFGFTEAHLSQLFAVGGRQFTLHGYKNTGGAKPFIVTALDDGKRYLLSRDQVRKGLGLTTGEAEINEMR